LKNLKLFQIFIHIRETIKLSAKTLKTYRGTLGKLRLSVRLRSPQAEMILPVMANRIRARTQIFKEPCL